MKKKQFVLFLIIVAVGIYYFQSNKKVELVSISVKDFPLQVELADTPKKQIKGLMYRKSLPENQGMLFVFDDERKHSFWMKNTKIPLDMFWINENLEIVHIKHSAPPCYESPCLSYTSTEPAKYVLELNGGWAIAHDVVMGDTVKLGD